jgi:hypothetical protein
MDVETSAISICTHAYFTGWGRSCVEGLVVMEFVGLCLCSVRDWAVRGYQLGNDVVDGTALLLCNDLQSCLELVQTDFSCSLGFDLLAMIIGND